MITSYHVHSTFSDGKSSIEENIDTAIQKGISEIGISDHYVIPPNSEEVSWSIKENDLDLYWEALVKAKEYANGKIEFRYGIEADYHPKTIATLKNVLAKYDFDYVIGSVHFLGNFPIDECPENWQHLSQNEINVIIKKYWKLIKDMAESGVFNIAAHLDLYKKFGNHCSLPIDGEIEDALDAIAKSNMAFEVNTSGCHKSSTAQEQYPSIEIIKKCYIKGIPAIVTADAHVPENLDRDFAKSIAILKQCNYSKQAIFKRRVMTEVDFDKNY